MPKAHGNVVAICDIDEKTLNSAGDKKFEGAQRFADYRVMLEKVGKDIDAVTVSTPDPYTCCCSSDGHERWARLAFCQKPLTHDHLGSTSLCRNRQEKKVRYPNG